MGFLFPKVPPTPKPPNPAINPAMPKASNSPAGYSSLIGTASPGLTRKADKNKVSLIGGG